MKKNIFILLLCLLGGVFVFMLSGSNMEKITVVDINETERYSIKPYHEALQLECAHCHTEANQEDYTELEDEQCLQCHKSKNYLAQRLSFMDKDKTNPHDSYHDGQTLSCYECHKSHEKSTNMCADCHNIDTWMKKIQ